MKKTEQAGNDAKVGEIGKESENPLLSQEELENLFKKEGTSAEQLTQEIEVDSLIKRQQGESFGEFKKRLGELKKEEDLDIENQG